MISEQLGYEKLAMIVLEQNRSYSEFRSGLSKIETQFWVVVMR